MTMKLQIKDAGAWRTVVNFEVDQFCAVKLAGEALLIAVKPTRSVLRVVDGDKVVLRCAAPEYEWSLPPEHMQ